MQVTLVESRGSPVGQVGNARVALKRCGFSCCKHMITTVETLTVEKGSSLKVLRAVEVYMRSERRIDYKQKVSFLDKASYQETDTDIGPNRVEDDAHIEMPEDMQQIAQKQ
uniref:Uncharacterized protein n=1 Tax=Wuchereria bancrofti TaxID=6293 RepID=A0AAF5RY52_WUCBA